jgi:RNA polymerase sigma factor (sigma-70 family)
MQDRDMEIPDYFHRIDSLKVDDAEEIELAFMLQNAAPCDPDLLRCLIARYAADVYRWVEVLLYYQQIIPPSQAQILACLQLVFSKAIRHTDQFYGQAHVSTWLFSITYQVIRGQAYIDWSMRFAKKEDRYGGLPERSAVNDWQALARLPEKQRAPLALRYLFGLSLVDIGAILNLQRSEVHRRLIRARGLLLAGSKVSDVDALLQAYLDGMYDDDPAGLSHVVQHVETCTDCQSSIKRLAGLEKSLAESLNQRFTCKQLDQAQQETLAHAVLSSVEHDMRAWKPGVNWGHIAWIAGLSTVFLVLALAFIRMTPVETEFSQAVLTPTPSLPPVVSMPPEITPEQNGGIYSQVPQYIAPAFSSDGNWGAFTLINVGTNTRADLLSSVEIYDRQANTLQVISKYPSQIRIPWVYWDLAPAISADGKLIVYVGATRDPSAGGTPCETYTHQPCLDIFLYNRETGSTMRLSQPFIGSAADGDSLAPTISLDGNVVAFWSAANNLVQPNANPCLPANPGATCLNIYLYDLPSEKIEQIPVGVIPGDVVFGVDRISLSADGRYVGFTATPSPQIARIYLPKLTIASTPGLIAVSPTLATSLPALSAGSPHEYMTDNPQVSNPLPVILQSSEAVVYDRQTGIYELENQAYNGTPGDGPSSTPVLSADGRYVAFVSASNNLVDGDYNNFSNVFVRDRQTGAVELVSVSSIGHLGNGDSGITYWGRGFFSLSLSSDARYIVFESAATNLATGVNPVCSRYDIPACTMLYVHDRQTGKTDFISTLSLSVLSHFPEISSDGRWVSFMQFSDLCLPTQNHCSNVMIYDRQREWLANLTGYGEQASSLPWTNSANLPLPWQAWESSALAFSSDGKLFAVGGFDAKIRIWHITNGIKSISQDQPDQILSTDGNDYFTTVAFSQDGRWLAAGTVKGLVDIWDVPSGMLLYSLKNQLDPIRKLEFSSDRSHLIFATLAETWIWSIGNNSLVQETSITNGLPAVFALDITSQGNLLATARVDGTVWLQSLPGGEVIARLGGQQVTIDSLAFSPDGSLLAARSIQGGVNLWKLSAIGTDHPSFSLLSSVPSYMYVGALVFSPDNKFLAATGTIGQITLWSVPEGKIYTLSSSVNNEMVYGVAFSQAGDMLAVIFEDQVGLWSFPPDYVSTYFTYATQDEFIDSLPIPASTADDIPEFTPWSFDGEYLTLAQAADLAYFPLLVPSHLPENVSFWGATVYQDGKVVLRYFADENRSSQSVLYVYEQLINASASPTMTVGATAQVSLTLIEPSSRDTLADYVRGDWKQGESISPPQAGEKYGITHTVWLWDNTSRAQRLRWQQNGVLVALYYQVDRYYTPVLSNHNQPGNITHLSPVMDQSDLIQIANGMDWYGKANLGPACYVAGGSLVYAIWPVMGYPTERLCLHPALISPHSGQKYGWQ